MKPSRGFCDPRRTIVRLFVFVFISILLISFTLRSSWFSPYTLSLSEDDLISIRKTAQEFAKDPIKPPYKHKFWEVGRRSRVLSQWMSMVDHANPKSTDSQELLAIVETTAQQLFPYLARPRPNPESTSPLSDLRRSFKPGSQGIVIPVGGGDQSIRFASHLIVTLREVVGCQLPIQLAYAGEEDLSKESRDRISSLRGATRIEFLDVLSKFDDTTLKLKKGGWAIKAFAVLASTFEEVILLDADAVFLQKPEILFSQVGYREKGALLFHDRLLWQHAFRERHDWWKDQIKMPSPEMNKSLVWTQDYAEECDSGVVVINKGRVDVLVGMLHVAWQNTHDVREEVTYRLGHGDKESWWLGLELAGSTYQFEAHYGSMLGWANEHVGQNVTSVCSFVIAHTDEKDRLLWYNGSLLKNKKVNPDGYEVPEYWMMDGKWHKGRTKKDMSCMTDTEAIPLTKREVKVLQESIKVARRVDAALKGKQ